MCWRGRCRRREEIISAGGDFFVGECWKGGGACGRKTDGLSLKCLLRIARVS